MENIYLPDPMEVLQVTQETGDVKRVRIRFRDPEKAAKVRATFEAKIAKLQQEQAGE